MSDPPNVVLVTTDQQRADVSAREAFPLDTTPFLDGLAERGAWFDRAYAASPVCAPSRVSALTGRFPSATGVRSNDAAAAARFDRDLFHAFDRAGYATALIGKNHSHLTPDRVDHWYELGHWGAKGDAARDDRTPDAAAFDEWIDDLGWSPSLEPTPFPPETQAVSRAVSAAVDWVESLDSDDRPFLLWLSVPEPHNPYQAPEPYFSLFPPDDLPDPEAGADALDGRGFRWEWSRRLAERRVAQRHPDVDFEAALARMRSNYLGMLRLIDDRVERFVGTLDDLGLRDDTLLVATSDHGDFVGRYGLMRKGVGELPEATTRVPLVVSGSEVEDGDGPRPEHVSLVDLLPTLCAAVGASVPDGVQGRNLWPRLTGEADGSDGRFDSVYAEAGVGGARYGPADAPPAEAASLDELNPVTQGGSTGMVRAGDAKLVFGADGRRRLYDLSDDPAELRNRYGDAEFADRRTELFEQMLTWCLRVRDDLPLPGYDLLSRAER